MEEAVEDERHPEIDGIDADLVQEEDAGENPDHGGLEGIEERVLLW